MTELEKQLLETLVALEDAAAAIRTGGPKSDLQSLFGEIEGLARQLPPGSHPDLVHYLHRKSYQKARLWLQGRGAENARGRC